MLETKAKYDIGNIVYLPLLYDYKPKKVTGVIKCDKEFRYYLDGESCTQYYEHMLFNDKRKLIAKLIKEADEEYKNKIDKIKKIWS